MLFNLVYKLKPAMDYTEIHNKYTTKTYKLGDHLFFDKAFDTPGFSHHGVYCGYNKVIHFWAPSSEKNKDSASVQYMNIKDFEKLARQRGSRVYVVDHGDERVPRRESVKRARQELGYGNYNALTNNCEHFVNHCILSQRRSFQVE